MRKDIIVFGIMAVLVVMGSIRFLDDNDYAKGMLTLHANVDNRESTKPIEKANVRMLLLDTDYLAGSSATSIGAGDTAAKIAEADLYGLAPGEYTVRVYAYGRDTRIIRHRTIIVQ